MRLFFILFVFISTSANAQKKEFVEMLPALQDPKIFLPFSSVEIIDARFDKTYVGAFTKGFTFRQQTVHKYEADFPGSFKNYFPLILERFIQFDKSSTDTLVILVKRFRLADHFDRYKIDPELILNVSMSFFSRNHQAYTKLNAVEKVYAVSMTDAQKRKTLDSLRTIAFGKHLEKIFQDRSWSKTSTVFTHAEIESGILKRFALPIFTDSVIQVGCYRNFNEFIMNRPSISNVKPVYKEGLKGFKTADGRMIPVDSCWGGSDGKNVFVVFRKTFNMLFLKDHGFVLRSYRSTADIKPPPDYGSAALQYGLIPAMFEAGIDWEPEFFHLNMDNGTIFLEELFGEFTREENHREILRKKN